jgi:hypothetical protein
VPPVEEFSVRAEVPVPPDDRARLVGLRDAVRPDDDEVAVRVTVPLNPPRLTRLIVEVEDEPEMKLTVVGEAVTL